MNAAKKIILLLWFLIGASLGQASAFIFDISETRAQEKSFSFQESRQAQPLQAAQTHQENGAALYDFAPDSLLAAKETQMLYRGVPGNGTQKALLGEQGVAIPRGTAVDEGSLIKHVLGEDVNAGVTSWTTDRAVAVRFSGPNGTIIEVPLDKVLNQVVPRPPVPKYGGECEVLLRGTVQGTPRRP